MGKGKTRGPFGEARFAARARVWALLSAGSVALLAGASPAHAQSDLQGRSIADRNAPEFSAEPVILGPFEAFPSISLITEYNDNIFASAGTPVEDVIISLRPELLLRDQRPDRIVRINLSVGIRQFLNTNTESSEQGRLSADARWGLGTVTQYRVGALVNRNTEQRRDIDSFTTMAEPISFTNLQATAGVTREFGPVRASLDGRVRGVEYDGFTTINDEQVDLSFRDFQVYSATARLSYARTRDREVYVQLTADDRNFQRGPTLWDGQVIQRFDRSSRGGRLELGYRQQVTELLYVDLRGGYLIQDFDDPALETVNSVAFDASLLWNISPLTSIELSGRRRVDETINPLISGLVRTEAAAQVEHELLRNLVLTGRAAYANLDQLDSLNDGDQWSVGLQADYRLDRNWVAMFEAERFERTGLFDFTQNEIRIGLRYNF